MAAEPPGARRQAVKAFTPAAPTSPDASRKIARPCVSTAAGTARRPVGFQNRECLDHQDADQHGRTQDSRKPELGYDCITRVSIVAQVLRNRPIAGMQNILAKLQSIHYICVVTEGAHLWEQ